MKKIIVFVSLAILCFNCEKKVDNKIPCCDPDGENAEQEWLEAWQANANNCGVCEVSLFKGECNGRTVYYTRMTDILCDGTPEAYLPYLIDCNGNIITDTSGCYHPVCFGEITEIKLLGRCKRDRSE